MANIDGDLATALKMAKANKVFFAFIHNGADGKLIVSKRKIPARQIAEAKKEIGGGTPVTGKCSGPLSEMVFLVAKPAASTLSAAIKKVVKRDTGLTVVPNVQLASDADTDEKEVGTAPAAPGQAAPPPPKTAPNLAPWQAARQNAINDLRALATKIAATKHGTAAGAIKEIQFIISKLPADPALNKIGELEDFVRSDDTIASVEEVPAHFHNLSVRQPLLDALKALKQ